MGKSTKMRRFLQKLAVMLAIIMAVPSINMPVDFFGSVTEVYADGKIATEIVNFDIGVIDEDKAEAEANIDIQYNKTTAGPKTPSGTMSLSYTMDDIAYDDNTGKPIITDDITWIDLANSIPLENYTFTIPKDFKNKSNILVKASYPGDTYFEGVTEYCKIDFKAPVIELVTEVYKDENEATPTFAFEISNDESFTNQDNEAEVDVFAMLTPYLENGYNTTAQDILASSIDLKESFNGEKCSLSFSAENVENGIYVLHIVCTDRKENISNILVTKPFSTNGKLYTNNDISASYDGEFLVYDGTALTPVINASALNQKDINRKNEVGAWLRSAVVANKLEYTFLRTADEFGNAVKAVSGTAISAAGKYNIYISAKDEEVKLLPGVYGTLTVKQFVDIKATVTDITYAGVAQTPAVTLEVVCEDETREASLQALLDSIIEAKNISYSFIQTKDGDGNDIKEPVASSTVKDAGTYLIYANLLDERIVLPTGALGTLTVVKSLTKPVVSGSAVLVSVSEDKTKYVVSVDKSCIINADEKELEYCFDGESFTTKNYYEVGANTTVSVQIRLTETKNTEVSETYKFPEITTPAVSAMPAISLSINEGTRLAVVTPKSSLGVNEDISKIEVYCTTDGKIPTVNAPVCGLGVTSFIIGNDNVTVKAVAVEPGKIMSDVATEEFTPENISNVYITTVDGLKIFAGTKEIKENDTINLDLFDANNSSVSVYGVITPDNALNKGVWWEVDKEGIVSLNKKTTSSGECLSIKALKEGFVTITASSVENPTKTHSFIVEVKPYTIEDIIMFGDKVTYEIPNPEKHDFELEIGGEHKEIIAILTKSNEDDKKLNLVINTRMANIKDFPYSFTIAIIDKENGKKYALVDLKVGYKIVYHSNGAKPIEDEVYTSTEDFILKTPEFEGFNFEGWYYKANYKKEVKTKIIDKKKVYYIPAGSKGNVDVYAKWSANPVTVTFKSNYEEANDNQTQQIKKNVETKLERNAFIREGYDFVGWTTKEGTNKVEYLDEQKVTFDSDKTLYAVWAKPGDEFTVTLKYDGEILSDPINSGWKILQDGLATYTYKYKNEKSYPYLPTKKQIIKENYQLSNWKLESGANIAKLGGMGGDLTLVADWKGNYITVTYYTNEKKLTNSKVSGSMKTEKLCYGETWVPCKCGFKAPGYTFVGWSTDPDAKAKDVISAMPSKFKYTENLKLYAIWKADKQYIRLYSPYGYVNTSSYKFGISKADGHLLTITYSYKDVKEESIKLPDESQMIYDNKLKFLGWYNPKPNNSGNYTGATKGKEKTSVNLGDTENYYVAKWSGNYKIVYHDNDKVNEETRNIGESSALRASKGKENYYFKGWALSKDGDEVFKDTQNISIFDLDDALKQIPEDITYHLYAVYKPIQEKNNLTILNEDGEILYEGVYNSDYKELKKELKTIQKNLGDKYGLKFTGYTDLNGKRLSEKILNSVVGELTLILEYSGNKGKVIINFDKNVDAIKPKITGNNTENKKVSRISGSVLKINKIEAEGYVLKGYSTDPYATEPEYYLDPNGYLYLNGSETHDGEHIASKYGGKTIILYAIWEPVNKFNSYTYCFNMGSIAPDNDGMTTPDYEKLYDCKKKTEIINGEVIVTLKKVKQKDNHFVLPEPVRVGYEFTGWMEKGSKGKTLIKTTEDITNESTRYLIATWKVIK